MKNNIFEPISNWRYILIRDLAHFAHKRLKPCKSYQTIYQSRPENNIEESNIRLKVFPCRRKKLEIVYHKRLMVAFCRKLMSER